MSTMNREQGLADTNERWIIVMIYDSYCIWMNAGLQIFDILWGHLSWITVSKKGYLGQHFFISFRKFVIDLQNLVEYDHVLDHLQQQQLHRIEQNNLHEDSSGWTVVSPTPSSIVVLPPLSPEPLHCGGNLNWLASALSDASAAVRKRGERLQANTTVLGACMMLSFCAPMAILLGGG